MSGTNITIEGYCTSMSITDEEARAIIDYIEGGALAQQAATPEADFTNYPTDPRERSVWADGWDEGYKAGAVRQAATPAPAEPTKPLFAVSVARRKWDQLQSQGYRMQRIYFDREDGSRGTIDAWGKVLWDDAAPPATPAAPTEETKRK